MNITLTDRAGCLFCQAAKHEGAPAHVTSFVCGLVAGMAYNGPCVHCCNTCAVGLRNVIAAVERRVATKPAPCPRCGAKDGVCPC